MSGDSETGSLYTHVDLLANNHALDSDAPFALEVKARLVRDDMTRLDSCRPTDTRRDCGEGVGDWSAKGPRNAGSTETYVRAR